MMLAQGFHAGLIDIEAIGFSPSNNVVCRNLGQLTVVFAMRRTREGRCHVSI